MGVQGLWELLTPVGRRVSVDALGSRKLAIDASIWIIQFMKAMRDDKGDMIRNAHLLGFFRRICKLLYLRIKPVFVFDGATPALKRRTVIARRRQREQAQSKIRKTAEKLLLNHLRTQKLEEIASEINLGSQSKNKINDHVEITQAVDFPADENSRPNSQIGLSGPSSSHDKYDQAATDALLAASLAADYRENLENGRGSLGGSGEGSDEDDDEEQLILPAVKGLDPSVLASLPPSMQLDLLVQMREQLVAENRQKFQKVAKVPSSFSAMQIQAYLKTVAFRREINEVQKAAAGGGIGGVPTARVASTIDREFIFSKTFEGEKPAPSEIEEQRQLSQAMPPTAPHSKLPTSLMRPSSAMFSSITGTQDKSVPEEDGVVSLVSTELNKDSDLNSNSVVHTYIDERGHVRVNRRRGMGVRMTRDLQWNLYLLKDVEARKLEEESISLTEEPPIIPSASIRDTTLPTPSAVQNSSVMGNGFQISFVDDGVSELSKDEDGDLFEELVIEEGDSREDQASVIHGPMFPQNNVGPVNLAAGVTNGEELEEEVDWEDGDINEESRDGSVVEDKDLAEAVRLSLAGQPPVAVDGDELSNQILLEDGPSSDESEVEWEDGTGDVSVVDLDGAVTEDLTGATLVPSEEAEVEEAIRRSLEDFHPPAKPSSQLVIKERADSNPKRESHDLELLSKDSPSVRAEAESEEVYLARERTRKGKAVLERDEEGSLSTTVVRRPYRIISEQDQIAALTLSGMPVIEATMQPPPATHVDNPPNVRERESEGKIDFRSICIPESIGNFRNAKLDAPNRSQERVDFEEELETTSVEVDQKNPESSRVEGLEMKPPSVQADVPLKVTDRENLAGIPQSEKPLEANGSKAAPPDNLGRQEQAGLPLVTDGPEVFKGPQRPSRPSPYADFNEEDPSREAEEMNAAIERDELQNREAALSAEREKLAREEENLQELLEMEQADLQAGFDRERELLAHEEMELLAAQKKNERNADSVTGEMFAEVQELLQMFGLPYIIAPMEAEAQCAYLDTIQLIDGIVTDDSDVFLFGGRTVYKNLFDDRKYVETYYMKDVESEMGMSREKLIRIAMLLGSDYTEGISGIGIVNAIEVVNAFPDEDGLKKFKEWLDSPDHALFQKVQGQPKGKGKSSGRGEKTAVDEGLDGDGAGDLDEPEDGNFTLVQKSFMDKHRGVSKNWMAPESFPSESVVQAYVSPVVDKSAETFTWGRPDLEALRRFCHERFIWNKEKADELLLPVLKEYDRRETQTRLESFFHFNQRFAKIRSRRIQKAVTGMTGKRSSELMDLPPHLITDAPPKKSRKKKEPLKPSDPAPENIFRESGNVQDDVDGAVDTRRKGAGRGGRGRPGRQGGKQQSEDLQSIDTVAGNVDNGLDVKDVSVRGGRKRARATTQGRGRGRGRGRPASDEEASISDSSDSDDAMEDTIGGAESLKRKEDTVQPRRSTRQRPQVVTYEVDDSDEEAGGTCSDGEEMFKEVDLLVAEALRNKPPKASPGIESTEMDIAVSSSDMATEGASFAKTSVVTDLAGPSEISDFATAGGFCPEEDDIGQTGQEMREPVYDLGGGFCLSDDEHNQPLDGGNGTVFEDNPLSQQRFGGGFCLLDEDGKELSQRETDFPQQHTDEHNDNRRPEKLDIETTKEVDQSALIPDTSVSGNGIQSLNQSSERAEFGLRAMPLMRRKKRKKSP